MQGIWKYSYYDKILKIGYFSGEISYFIQAQSRTHTIKIITVRLNIVLHTFFRLTSHFITQRIDVIIHVIICHNKSHNQHANGIRNTSKNKKPLFLLISTVTK